MINLRWKRFLLATIIFVLTNDLSSVHATLLPTLPQAIYLNVSAPGPCLEESMSELYRILRTYTPRNQAGVQLVPFRPF